MKKNNFLNSDNIFLFHNNRCSKSREVKKYLDDNNIIYEVLDYLNIIPEKSFLKSVLLKLENNFQEIIRVNEKIYKNLNDNEKIHTFENIINLVIKYPILLQRPILSIERNKIIIQSIICRPTELINQYLIKFYEYKNSMSILLESKRIYLRSVTLSMFKLYKSS